MSEGSHTVSIMVTDRAMNSHIVSVTFTVDLTAPALEITYPTDNGIYAVAAITAEWSATDGSSGLLGYGYRIDGGQWSVLSMTDSHIYAGLGEGLHTLDVYAMDNVLNNATVSVTFMVDTVQPSISITSPTIDQIFNQSSVAATWTGDDVTSQIAGYYYRMDSGAWSDLTSDTSHTFPGLGEGSHTVTVGAQDNAGNVQVRLGIVNGRHHRTIGLDQPPGRPCGHQ